MNKVFLFRNYYYCEKNLKNERPQLLQGRMYFCLLKKKKHADNYLKTIF